MLLPAILDMTHSKLVKTVNRKTHPQNCPYQSWRLGRLMLRCGDHSRSRPVDCLAAELSPLIENLAAVYGRETDLKELLPFPIHCPACQNPLAECRSSAAAAIIVDLAGIVVRSMSHYAAGVHPALALGCCIGTTTGCVKGGMFFMESYQASVASCYLLFLALVCRGFSSSMLAWSGSTRHSLVKRMCSLRRLPAYVCSSAKVGLHGAFSQGHWGQI